MTTLALLLASTALAFLDPAAIVMPQGLVDRSDTSDPRYLPGRAEDARVAGVAWRLAVAGRARCPRTTPASGLVLQHLSQFQLADRAGILATLPLTRGPGVIAIVPGGPAANAGIRAGDVLLAIDGVMLPPEPALDAPFDAARAHARADGIADLLEAAHGVTLLRAGATLETALAPLSICPSRVHLARSGQRNAFADGRHVFVTTGMLGLLRNDDELAFLIAHEMAHNVLGHAAVMRGGTVKGGSDVRRIENAADLLGGEMMLDAGFDPVLGAQLLSRIDGAAFGIALFARHDPPAARIAALRALAAARGPR